MMLIVRHVKRRFVAPFYMDVLHGNLVALASSACRQDEIVREMRAVAPEVSLDTAVYLWSQGWREALMASWWAAVWQWPETVDQVEPLLIPSRSCFEGQAHCLALTRVRSSRARAVLTRYLDEYLPRPDLDYDQPWAMAALKLACADAAEPVPGRYLKAWQQWNSGKQLTDLDELMARLNRMRVVADAVRHP
jgi:hypothetical protein